jgi:hydrogenase maturation protease
MNTKSSSTIILGLGNPILGDDGVGWRVVEQTREAFLHHQPENPEHQVDFELLSVGGLTLMEHLTGYDRAIIVDALSTGKQPAGTISCIRIEELPENIRGHISSAHDTTIKHALQLGRQLGAQLPSEIRIVMIEADQVYNFSEQLSFPIEACLPRAVDTIMEMIK